jgi:hypothetical protein
VPAPCCDQVSEAFPIFDTVQIAKLFFECLDKAAIDKFRTFMARHLGVKKWIIAADFSLGKERPLGCFAFTVVPYDAWPWELERDAIQHLAKDLKESKSVPQSAIGWLRDNRRFHFAVTVKHKRSVFVGGTDGKRAAAREFVAKTLAQVEENRERVDVQTVDRLKLLKTASLSNGFNVQLLSDIWLLAVLLAAIAVLIGREGKSEIIGWFPDRDKMTNWCDGIWHDFAFWNSSGFADAFDVDLRRTQIVIALPHKSTGEEIMWFDHLLRAADWFAGAVAEWDRKTSLNPDRNPKYREMWEEVIAGAENVVVLHLDIDEKGAQFRRIDAQRIEPHATKPKKSE